MTEGSVSSSLRMTGKDLTGSFFRVTPRVYSTVSFRREEDVFLLCVCVSPCFINVFRNDRQDWNINSMSQEIISIRTRE